MTSDYYRMSSQQIEWQDTYEWSCKYPEETEMDTEFWWNSCLNNILAKALQGTTGIVSKGELKAPTPANQWKSDMLTELYGVLFPGNKPLTIGQFKNCLEKVKPGEE